MLKRRGDTGCSVRENADCHITALHIHTASGAQVVKPTPFYLDRKKSGGCLFRVVMIYRIRMHCLIEPSEGALVHLTCLRADDFVACAYVLYITVSSNDWDFFQSDHSVQSILEFSVASADESAIYLTFLPTKCFFSEQIHRRLEENRQRKYRPTHSREKTKPM